MKKELEEKIENEFPFMRRDCIEGSNLYKEFGLAISDGWFSIIWGMCEEIKETYAQERKEVDFVPVQIKEKFGALRVYYDVNGEKKAIHAFDFLGTGFIRIKSGNSEFYGKISDIVSKWENRSAATCEECGKEGVLRKDLRWLKTLCDDCYSKRFK